MSVNSFLFRRPRTYFRLPFSWRSDAVPASGAVGDCAAPHPAAGGGRSTGAARRSSGRCSGSGGLKHKCGGRAGRWSFHRSSDRPNPAQAGRYQQPCHRRLTVRARRGSQGIGRRTADLLFRSALGQRAQVRVHGPQRARRAPGRYVVGLGLSAFASVGNLV